MMKGTRPLSKDEVNLVKESFHGRLAIRNRSLFLFGVNTGFRVSELLSLRIDDILTSDGKIKDRVIISRRFMKGKKSSRNVLINSFARKGIEPLLKQLGREMVVQKDDYIFRSQKGVNKHITREQAWRVLTMAFKSAGLDGPLGTHSMRKTFANNIYIALLQKVADGHPIDAFRLTSKALGHADIKNTDRYLSFSADKLEEVILQVGV